MCLRHLQGKRIMSQSGCACRCHGDARTQLVKVVDLWLGSWARFPHFPDPKALFGGPPCDEPEKAEKVGMQHAKCSDRGGNEEELGIPIPTRVLVELPDMSLVQGCVPGCAIPQVIDLPSAHSHIPLVRTWGAIDRVANDEVNDEREGADGEFEDDICLLA